MLGKKYREEERENELDAVAAEQASAAEAASETDDASFDSDEALEESIEPDEGQDARRDV